MKRAVSIYFRQPQKVILRIEGRTPNDDPAEFQIKFAGNFEAAVPTDAARHYQKYQERRWKLTAG